MQTNILLGIASALLGLSVALEQTIKPVVPLGAGRDATEEQASGDKYVFILFHEGGSDTATRTVWHTLEVALAKRPGQAIAVNVRVNDPAMKTVVESYGVGHSPMPLVLAIAPNGAVTGAFAIKLTEQDIASAFVSLAQAACMKEEQTRQLVSRLVAPSTATWPTISTWYLVTSRPATSNPAIVSRCCSCFKSSAAREAPSLLTDHLLHLTDYCLLADTRSCLDENVLEPRHWPMLTGIRWLDTVRSERGAN